MSKTSSHLQEETRADPVRAEHDAPGSTSNFIRQLIDLRRRKGLSQRQLAKLVGTHQPSISRLEAGRISSITFLQKVADALDANIEIHFVPRQAGPARHLHSKLAK
jgi:transcriptional regulator with XRE-family HTH domain